MLKVVVLSQFVGPNYEKGIPWRNFLLRVANGEFNDHMRPPQFLDIELEPVVQGLEWRTPWGTTAYRESSDGTVEVFQTNWDSSG